MFGLAPAQWVGCAFPLQRWRRPTIATAAALRDFARQHAAFIAQKCAIDYCRTKAGLFSYQLFKEQDFMAALTRCRWEGYGAVLADILIVLEAFLRPSAGSDAAAIADRLAAWYPEILALDPPPAHRPQGWADAIARFDARMGAARAAPPRGPAAIAEVSGRLLYEALPIHTSYRRFDQEMVVASVCFRMVSMWQEMERRVDRAAVCADLAGRPAAGGV
ncbi:MAG: hypothetical protein AB7K86_19990 [Rhodospirillales bacterium]